MAEKRLKRSGRGPGPEDKVAGFKAIGRFLSHVFGPKTEAQGPRPVSFSLRFKYVIASALFLFFLCWLLICAVPTLYWGDSAEMTSVACSAGVAHSPGYPLFSIVAGAFLALPLFTPFAANLMSVFFAAAAIAVLFLFLAKVTRGTYAAAAGALMFASVPAFIFQSLFIEVYAFHIFLFCAVLYAVASHEHSGDQRWFYASLLLLSLGMSHHILMYFVLVAYLLYCILRPGHDQRVAAIPILWFFAWSFMNILITHDLAADYMTWYKWGLGGLAGIYLIYVGLLAWRWRPKFMSAMISLATGLFIFAAATWIFAYLPLASARGPAADWWSPDTPGNFLNLLFLKGYPPTFPKTILEFYNRVDFAGLLYQTPPAASWWIAILLPLSKISSYYVYAIAAIVLITLLVKRANLVLFLMMASGATFIGALLVKHGKPEALRIPVYLALVIITTMIIGWILNWKFWRGRWWRIVLSAPLYILVVGAVLVNVVQVGKPGKTQWEFGSDYSLSKRVDWRMMARSGSAYELGSEIIDKTDPGGLLFIGVQTPSIMGYFSACEPAKLAEKKIVLVPVSFLSFDWKIRQLRRQYRRVYFPPPIPKPEGENVFSASGDDHVKYVLEMMRANPEHPDAFSDFYFVPLSSGYLTLPHGAVYRIVHGADQLRNLQAGGCGQLKQMLASDVPPRWKQLDNRDSIAAENIASVSNERGILFFQYGKEFGCQDIINLAETEFASATQINPSYAEALSNKGKCEFALGNVDEAIKLQRSAVKLKPEMPEIHNELAETLLQTHTESGARQALAELMSSLVLSPNQPRVYYSLGNVYTMMQDKNSAVKFYNRAIEMSPDYIEAYRALSRLLEATGACAESVTYLEMAAERLRNNPDPRAYMDIRAELVIRYYKCGFTKLFSSGMEDFFRDFQPHNLDFFQAVGTIYRDIGMLDKSVLAYRAAMQQNPGAAYKLADMFRSLAPGDCDTNVPILEKVVKLAPEDFSVRFLLGTHLYICGFLPESEQRLLEAKKIDPAEKGVDELLTQLKEDRKQRPDLFAPAKPAPSPAGGKTK